MAEKILIGSIAYKLTDNDKTAIAEAVKASLPKEIWTFTLKDGSAVQKVVYVE